MARGKKGVKDIHETMPSSVDVLSQASKAKTCKDTRRLEDVYVYIYIIYIYVQHYLKFS